MELGNEQVHSTVMDPVHGNAEYVEQIKFTEKWLRLVKGNVNKIFYQARGDWTSRLRYRAMHQVDLYKRRVRNEILVDAVRFIFQVGNVQLLSWATIFLRTRMGGTVIFQVLEDFIAFHISEDYEAERKASLLLIHGKMQKSLGRTRFPKIVNSLTQGQQDRSQKMDYIISVLLYEILNVLWQSIQSEVNERERRKHLLQYMVAIQHSLKFAFAAPGSRDNADSYCPDHTCSGATDRWLVLLVFKLVATCVSRRFKWFIR